MNPMISSDTFGHVFAWAPLVLGVAIYAIVWFAKRAEVGGVGVPIGQTYACAGCGRRSVREHMLPQTHEGAVSYFCSKCAGAH